MTSRAVALATVVLLFAVSTGAHGQVADDRRLAVGLSLGVFADYPTDFRNSYCDGKTGGVSARAEYRLGARLSVDATATTAGEYGATTCAIPLRPAPLDGQAYSRSVLPEGLGDPSFIATDVGIVLEPFPGGPVHVRAGVGRLWDKELTNAFFGAGVRRRFGPNALVLEVERWHLAYDLIREVYIYRQDGLDELQTREVLPRSPRPYLIRIGWVRVIG